MMRYGSFVLLVFGFQLLITSCEKQSFIVSPVIAGQGNAQSLSHRNQRSVPAAVTEFNNHKRQESGTLRCKINAQCSIPGQLCCEAFLGQIPGTCYDPTVSACCALDGSVIPLNLTSPGGQCCAFNSGSKQVAACPSSNSPTLNKCGVGNVCTSSCSSSSSCGSSGSCCIGPNELSGSGSCFTPASEICCFDGRVCESGVCDIPQGGQCCSVNVTTGAFTFCASPSRCGFYNGSLQCLKSDGTVAAPSSLDSTAVDNGSNSHLGLILGIAIPVAAVIIVAIIVGAILLRRKKNKPTQKIVEPTVPPAYKGPSAAPIYPGYQGFAVDSNAKMPPGYFSAVDMQGGYITMDSTGNPNGPYSFISSLDAHTAIEWTEIELMQSIGQGSFGEVYKSRWHAAYVAVKKIHPELLDNTDAVNNFYREADILKKLKPHPNTVLFFGITKEPVALIMEFCEKGSLYQYLHSSAEIPIVSKRRFLIGVARGMIHLHFYNIIHRDLAARNILLTGNFDVKVSDFGFSRFGGDLENRIRTPVGPVNWFPPEALKGQIFSSKTDVWSFGVVIWEVITRQDPFSDKTPADVISGVSNTGLTLEAPKDCPQDLANLMQLCFRQTPSERPTFMEILAILEQENVDYVPA